jgi:hypothetical protein
MGGTSIEERYRILDSLGCLPLSKEESFGIPMVDIESGTVTILTMTKQIEQDGEST